MKKGFALSLFLIALFFFGSVLTTHAWRGEECEAVINPLTPEEIAGYPDTLTATEETEADGSEAAVSGVSSFNSGPEPSTAGGSKGTIYVKNKSHYCAKVYLDNKFVSNVPSGYKLTISKVTLGTHTLYAKECNNYGYWRPWTFMLQSTVTWTLTD